MSLEGWRSFDMARASIWRIRSRVRLKCSPTSSSVRGSPRSRPKRSLRMSRSRLSRRRQQAHDLVGQHRGGGRVEGRVDGPVLHHVPQLGVAVLAQRLRQRQRLGLEAQRLSDLVLGHLHLGGQLRQRGGPPVLQLEAERAFWRRARVSPAWTGRRMVRPVLAMPRVMAWRIHQVA